MGTFWFDRREEQCSKRIDCIVVGGGGGGGRMCEHMLTSCSCTTYDCGQ